MVNYEGLKKSHGNRVSQTIDSPIMIFDFWELTDAFAALVIILIFGLVLYCWGLMSLLLVLVLAVGPIIRRRNKPGVFFHWPYRNLGVELPGLLNPRGRRKYSD